MGNESITLKILKGIVELATETGDFALALIQAGYGAPMYKIHTLQEQNRNARINRNKEYEDNAVLRRRLSKMLYKLKKA